MKKQDNRTEFEPRNEVESFIKSTVVSHYEEYGYKENTEIFASDGLGVILTAAKTHEMTNNFHEFWENMIKKLAPRMVQAGYRITEAWECEGFVIQNFVKVPENVKLMVNDELRQSLKHDIYNVYAEYHVEEKAAETAGVNVYEDEVVILLNSEKPYLGRKFWSFTGKVEEAIHEKLKAEGYTFQKTEWLYDFLVWHYKKEA